MLLVSCHCCQCCSEQLGYWSCLLGCHYWFTPPVQSRLLQWLTSCANTVDDSDSLYVAGQCHQKNIVTYWPPHASIAKTLGRAAFSADLCPLYQFRPACSPLPPLSRTGMLGQAKAALSVGSRSPCRFTHACCPPPPKPHSRQRGQASFSVGSHPLCPFTPAFGSSQCRVLPTKSVYACLQALLRHSPGCGARPP